MEKWKDILIRAVKTFIQGFIAAILVSLETREITDRTVLKSILIGAVAGGVSAVMNMTLDLLKKEEIEDGRNTRHIQ